MPDNYPASIRLDKWLWYARLQKSRSKTARLVKDGKVRVNRERISRASYSLRPGDVVTIAIAHNVFVLEVLKTGNRRGSASEAQALYRDLSPAPSPQRARPRPHRPERDKGAGRPTKRDRRQTDRLRRNTLYDGEN